MKILIIQLARPGDIYCSWPVLSALRRENPTAEIHFLVRKKFAAASADFSIVDHFWHFDSQKWMYPLIEDSCNLSGAMNELGTSVAKLKAENFDKIINLTFSPASSFLTHMISNEKTEVRGYTRTSDFYLHSADESSRYFRAQVGIGKSNRVHVNDLFGMVAGVEVLDSDLSVYKFNLERNRIVCHLGASQEQKTWAVSYWAQLIEKFISEDYKITLVGGHDDLARGAIVLSAIEKSNPQYLKKIENLIGKTTFSELGRIFSESKLFIGADSGPLHVANGAGCKILNLSLGPVNYWETGPTTVGSQVLVSANPSNLLPEEVFLTSKSILENDKKNPTARFCDGQRLVRYDDNQNDFDRGWYSIQWLYFGGEKPELSEVQKKLTEQIFEVCEIALQQLDVFRKDNTKVQSLSILERSDEILKIISKTDRGLRPVLDLFFTNKENIVPALQEEVINQTVFCYEDLKNKTQNLLLKESIC